MFGYPKWRAWTIIAVSALAVFFSIPNFMPRSVWEQKVPAKMQSWWRPMTLGLDLQGGAYLLLEVQTDELVKERLNSMADSARTALREARIKFNMQGVQDGKLNIRVLSDADVIKAQGIIAKLDTDTPVEFEIQENVLSVFYPAETVDKMKADATNQSVEIVRRRLDETGTKELSIQRQGADRIVVQLPGEQNPAAVKQLLGKTAKMTFHLVDENTTLADAKRGLLPAGSMRLPERSGGDLILLRKVIVGGEQLKDARQEYGQNGEVVVGFSFHTLGAKQFAKATAENIGRRLAIVLDGEVLTAPTINSEIVGSGIITGNFTVKEASDLALMLRSGALPAPLTVVEERVVGAGLGEDSIKAGAYACLIGSVMVFIFMLLVYGRFGMFANVALLINVFLLFAVLSAIGATLTLPGLAGIALTIGMAVDSNVLIFERMRDEAKLGRSPLAVIDAGFEHALTAIVDSQITTLMAAAVLFFMGSGPIKGFSITLGIGVLTSLFTATMVTKFLIMIWYSVTKPKSIKL